MSFLGTSDLKKLLPTCIDPYKDNHIEQAAYELSLGNEVFLTDAESKKPEILSDSNQTIDINPGQFALLHTLEKVTVPNDKLCFISIKAGEKFKGLVNISGFHIDPGFSGEIIFSVYNAGPSIITLKRGTRYFLIFFSDLNTELKEDEAYSDKGNHHQFQKGLPIKYIEVLKNGDLASPNKLLERIKANEKTFDIEAKRLDSKRDYNKWLLGFLIVVFAGIAVKLYSDWNFDQYKKGIEEGLKQKTLNEELRKAANDYSLDNVFLKTIDSLIDRRIKTDSLKKQTGSVKAK
jgi:dCTP deaminase